MPHPSRKEAWIAWMPWIILSILLFFWGVPQFKNYLNSLSLVKISVPYLDKAVLRTPPVVSVPKAEDAVLTFNWLSASGTGLLLSGIISGLLLGIKLIKLGVIHSHLIAIAGGTEQSVELLPRVAE